MAEAIAEQKRQYEAMFILDANLGGKQWDKARDQLKEFLESRGAEIVRMEKWEERKLAYEIGKHKRGLYVLAYFKAPTSRLAKIKKDCRLTEWLVREIFLVHEGAVTDELFRKPKLRERDFEDGPERPPRAAGAVEAAPEGGEPGSAPRPRPVPAGPAAGPKPA
ncbi:MAG: 30S ribosomal protein S6 [Planctomycetes bacterium]|jgi:small subunit ribosomal protein S6|nr:30S ribosomal protein S6 [Planctomycetota bacterium]